jgi:hypothetical protein
MLVKELFIALSKLDPEMRVMVQGYEGGLKDLTDIEVTQVTLDEWQGMTYYGPHERAEHVYDTLDDKPAKTTITAVILPR